MAAQTIIGDDNQLTRITQKAGHWTIQIGQAVFTGDETAGILGALLNNFHRQDVEPDKLDAVLRQFRLKHAELREWKELHNRLDGISIPFDSYRVFVERIHHTHRLFNLTEMRKQWRIVSDKVCGLLDWGASIEHIGVPYCPQNGSPARGEKWALVIGRLNRDMCFILEIDPSDPYVVTSPQQEIPTPLQCAVFRRFRLGMPWWTQLYEITGAFHNCVRTHMSGVDAQLRLTAGELCDLSSKHLGASYDV